MMNLKLFIFVVFLVLAGSVSDASRVWSRDRMIIDRGGVDLAHRPRPAPLFATRSRTAQSSCNMDAMNGIGMLADVNGDGIVDSLDVTDVAARWHLTAENPDPDGDPLTPNYEIHFDVAPDDPDGVINVLDLARVIAALGNNCRLRFIDEASSPLVD